MVKYFITGITGSLGRAVTEKLLEDPDAHVIGYSRDELKQSEIPFHPRLTLVLGDVRDQRRLTEATRGVDIIYHFAALKRVDKMEENPEECIATNIEGTMNVLGAQRTNKIKRVVLSSTDKAAHSETVYGSSKFLSEKLVLRNPHNVVCRYGNVLASRGSVIPMFVDSIRKHGFVNITHPAMTRFFISIDEAAKFVVGHSFRIEGGLKIPDLKGCKIIDLADVICHIMGFTTLKVKLIGIRNQEKLHECMRTDVEGGLMMSHLVEQFTRHELIKLVEPIVMKLIKESPYDYSRVDEWAQA